MCVVMQSATAETTNAADVIHLHVMQKILMRIPVTEKT
jgi:hypothetical protein